MGKVPHEQFYAWVAYLDIFGFSASVRDEELTKLTQSLHKGHLIIIDRFKNCNATVYTRFISDSIFLIYRVNDNRAKLLQSCIEDVQRIMAEFVELDLPLRGGIAYGEITLGTLNENLLLGEAVIRAVHSEANVPAPFVVLPLKELKDLERNECPRNVKRIPIKGDGLMNAAVIMPHPVDGLLRLAKKYRERYCTDGPYHLGKVWDEAVIYIERSRDGNT